jgi:hypothetical protein
MVRKEGLSSFFKGLTPKILVVGPKLVFSYTLAQSLIPFFGKFGEFTRGRWAFDDADGTDLRSVIQPGIG